MPALKIAIHVGMTVQVGTTNTYDFLKPAVTAELSFEEVPSEAELAERWSWLWDSQVSPQADQLLELMQRQLSSRHAISAAPRKPAPEVDSY